MTRAQEHALSVIRARGLGAQIVDGKARCGWHRCSFSVQTVRCLAAQGHLVRQEGPGEMYTLATAPKEEKP